MFKKKPKVITHSNISRRSLLTMKAEQNLKDDYETYLGNPLNSFRLIHRLHTDWRKWHHYASKANRGELGTKQLLKNTNISLNSDQIYPQKTLKRRIRCESDYPPL